MSSILRLFVLPLAVAAGCAARPGTAPNRSSSSAADPVAVVEHMPALQVARVDPSLKGLRYSVLLDFELADDDAFVAAAPGASAAIDAERAMTGDASLRIGAAGEPVSLKLGSLLVGREFPATWTLLGGSLYAERPATATVTLAFDDGQTLTRTQSVEPGKWSAAWIDLTAIPRESISRPATLTFEIAGRGGDVWLDDVLMLDNAQWLVGGSPGDEPWSVRRSGYALFVESPNKFRMRLDTAAGKPNGWNLDEVGPARLRLSSAGETKFLTVYADGRSYWDGEPRPLSPQARAEPQDAHRAPAAVAVAETMGRPNRRTPGDLNNDAYNERLGAYQVTASGSRIDVTLSPRSAPLIRPVLEIAGLPHGKPLVTVEGRLVDPGVCVRTPDGHLLITLPFRIDRTTTVNVRVTG
jgi:hypothetical protein